MQIIDSKTFFEYKLFLFWGVKFKIKFQLEDFGPNKLNMEPIYFF